MSSVLRALTPRSRKHATIDSHHVDGPDFDFPSVEDSCEDGPTSETQSQEEKPSLQRQPSHVVEGVIQGLEHSLAEAGKSMEQLIRKPVEGAEKDGPMGFVIGLGEGVGGLANGVYKVPFHLLSATLEGVRNTPEAMVDFPRWCAEGGDRPETMRRGSNYYLPKMVCETEKEPEHVGEGILRGSQALTRGVLEGVGDLFAKPIEGALDNGPAGFVQGLGDGAYSFVAKPVSGALDLSQCVCVGLRNTPDAVDKATQYGLEFVCKDEDLEKIKEGPSANLPLPGGEQADGGAASSSTAPGDDIATDLFTDLFGTWGNPKMAAEYGADECLDSPGCTLYFTKQSAKNPFPVIRVVARDVNKADYSGLPPDVDPVLVLVDCFCNFLGHYLCCEDLPWFTAIYDIGIWVESPPPWKAIFRIGAWTHKSLPIFAKKLKCASIFLKSGGGLFTSMAMSFGMKIAPPVCPYELCNTDEQVMDFFFLKIPHLAQASAPKKVTNTIPALDGHIFLVHPDEPDWGPNSRLRALIRLVAEHDALTSRRTMLSLCGAKDVDQLWDLLVFPSRRRIPLGAEALPSLADLKSVLSPNWKTAREGLPGESMVETVSCFFAAGAFVSGASVILPPGDPKDTRKRLEGALGGRQRQVELRLCEPLEVKSAPEAGCIALYGQEPLEAPGLPEIAEWIGIPKEPEDVTRVASLLQNGLNSEGSAGVKTLQRGSLGSYRAKSNTPWLWVAAGSAILFVLWRNKTSFQSS